MDVVTFGSDSPDASLLPVDELADCAATVLARDGKVILSYGSGAGYSPLRELIAQWFRVHPSRVMLTNGWTQGLSLLIPDLVARRSVAVEFPSDERVLKAFLSSEASIIYLAADENGLLTTDLEQQLIQYTRPALIFVNPSFANPTGWTLSEWRRRHLLELLDNFNSLSMDEMCLLEDETYALTRFDGERVPALFDISSGRTIYSSSFSAIVAPGIRVGWLILPENLAVRIARRARDTYISPALLGQATVFEFIRRGSFEPHLMKLRQQLKERRDAMLAALAEHLPQATWSRPEGGYFVWVELPLVDGRAVLARAEGVTAVAGTEFGAASRFIRLSYASVPASEIPAGIERLAAAVEAQLEESSAVA